jgi:hypothetical protein
MALVREPDAGLERRPQERPVTLALAEGLILSRAVNVYRKFFHGFISVSRPNA